MSSFPEDTPGPGHNGAPTFDPDKDLTSDFDTRLMRAFIKRLVQRFEDPSVEVSVSEMEMVRKLLADNSISFSSIKRGDFGEVARKTAEEFPFPAGGPET